jgi:hypothetical protein
MFRIAFKSSLCSRDLQATSQKETKVKQKIFSYWSSALRCQNGPSRTNRIDSENAAIDNDTVSSLLGCIRTQKFTSTARGIGYRPFWSCDFSAVQTVKKLPAVTIAPMSGAGTGMFQRVRLVSRGKLHKAGNSLSSVQFVRQVCISNSVTVLAKSCFNRSAISGIAFESTPRLTQIKEACFQYCALKAICLPCSVESLRKSCFRQARIETVTFEPQSRLTRIGRSCFRRSLLMFICIPRSVESIGESCFRGSRLERIMFETDSRLAKIDEFSFQHSFLKSISIPRTVQILGNSCFSNSTLWDLVIGNDSQLMTIDISCFVNCRLRSLHIPRNIDLIDGSVFIGSSITAISVDPGNRRYSTRQCFLFDVIDSALVRHFGDQKFVCVWMEIEILGRFCFAGSELKTTNMETISFKAGSKLGKIEEFCFAYCSFRRMSIPRSAEVFGKFCFHRAKIAVIEFEPESKLSKIDDSCFLSCWLVSIQIPRSVESLGKACFQSADIQQLIFDPGSNLVIMEESCFAYCSLKSIAIPKSVQILGKWCFHRSEIEIVLFESGSQLCRIDQYCFSDCWSLKSISIPNHATVSRSAFDRNMKVLKMKRHKSCAVS